MGMTVILVIFSVFAISRSSGFDIPSLSAILKLNLGPPSVSSHGTAVPNRVSSSMSTSSILKRKRFVNLAPEASSPLTAPSRHIGKFHKYHYKPIHQGSSVAPSDSLLIQCLVQSLQHLHQQPLQMNSQIVHQ